MCMSKTPKVKEPDPTPTFEEAKPADEEMTARQEDLQPWAYGCKVGGSTAMGIWL